MEHGWESSVDSLKSEVDGWENYYGNWKIWVDDWKNYWHNGSGLHDLTVSGHCIRVISPARIVCWCIRIIIRP